MVLPGDLVAGYLRVVSGAFSRFTLDSRNASMERRYQVEFPLKSAKEMSLVENSADSTVA